MNEAMVLMGAKPEDPDWNKIDTQKHEELKQMCFSQLLKMFELDVPIESLNSKCKYVSSK